VKYPKECPVVEWIDKRDNLFPRGELFEVVELYERYDYGTGIKFYRCFHRTSTGKTGLYGIWSLAMNQIRPLTPAARAMLAIAKAAGK